MFKGWFYYHGKYNLYNSSASGSMILLSQLRDIYNYAIVKWIEAVNL